MLGSFYGAIPSIDMTIRPSFGARTAWTRPDWEAGLRPAGGCGFAVDPALDAAQAPVFWRSEIAPAVVVRLAPALPDSPLAMSLAGFDAEQRSADDGLHLRLAVGLQILLPADADLAAPMAAVLPLDAGFLLRSAAAQRLYRTLRSGSPPANLLSPTRRARLRRILRAIDARAAGAHYREVAEHILGVRVVDSAIWRASPARDVAIRLCRAGARLVRGGYLALLRRHP